MFGRVEKCNSNLFLICSNNNKLVVSAKKNLKNSSILVGDIVEIENDLICRVITRKNCLIRPPIANLDKLFIVLASIPKPDFLILDKLLVFCYEKGIKPVIVVNKEDINDRNFHEYIKNVYSSFVKVINVSSVTSFGIDNLKDEIGEFVCAFAGQSAVGKSSLMNILVPEIELEVGDLSSKINRGKNTTRSVQLFKCGNGFIADTPGFNLLDEKFLMSRYDNLKSYYPDYIELSNFCKFNSCLHDKEINCAIKDNVLAGKLDKERYKRYLLIKNSLYERWRKKYE